jgi:hypothetical protein
MSNNGLLDQDVRVKVADAFVEKMLKSPPEKQELILRMIFNKMSRQQIDAWYIAQRLYADDRSPEKELANE